MKRPIRLAVTACAISFASVFLCSGVVALLFLRPAPNQSPGATFQDHDTASSDQPTPREAGHPHNELLRALARRMERNDWFYGDGRREIVANPLVFFGNGVRPPDSAFDTYVKLSEKRDTSEGCIWFMVHQEPGRLNYRQLDEPHRLAVSLAPEFPSDAARRIDKMLRAAERAYQRDVLGSQEPDLEGNFTISPPGDLSRGVVIQKGKRLGEPDYWRYDVRVQGTTDAYQIGVWLMEERYEQDRAVVDVKLVPR